MPTLYNGCGTSYAGKANPERHPGVCDGCGHTGMLDQYDTRLCVTILFIPLIPFRRLRILDECPRCKRHRAARLREYEMNRQLAVSAALTDWREHPGVEKAVAAHQVMKAFRQQGHADLFMRELQSRFHADARLKAYHGTMLLEEGRVDEARLQLDEALKLQPELAEARVPMSRILMHREDAEGALQMLEFMLHPGSSQLHNLGPLEHLARWLFVNGRSRDALRLFKHLVEELPAVAQVPAFRAEVEKVENVTRSGPTILPPKRFSMQDVLFGTRAKQSKWALFIAVAAVLFVLRNFWLAGHRTVHVVNAFGEPAVLQISGGRTITAPPGRSTFTVAEGSYRISVSGPVEEVIPVTVQTDFWSRWSESPVWLLNPGGAAVLMENTVTVSDGLKTVPPPPKMLVGERFVSRSSVTHLFRELPERVQLKRGQSVTYRQLTEYEGPMAEAVTMLAALNPRSALAVAHKCLQQNPGDALLVNAVAPLLQDEKLAAQHEAFLRPYVEARPVSVEWHRAWQGAEIPPARCEHFVGVYDSLLRDDPQNAALLYLRGRVAPPAEREEWYRRALEQEPDHVWAHYGMAWHHRSRGEDENALRHLETALKKRPRDETMLIMADQCRAALDPNAAAVFMLNDPAMPPVRSFTRAVLAAALFGAKKQVVQARLARDNFAGNSNRPLQVYLEVLSLYAEGDHRNALSFVQGMAEAPDQLWFDLKLAAGKPLDAAKHLPPGDAAADAALSLALAFQMAGDAAAAGTWLRSGIKALRSGDSDEVLLAGLLEREAAPSLEEVQTASVYPALKALALASLAQRFPDRAAEYAPAARRLSAVPLPPMQLVRQAFAKIPPP